MRATDFFHQAVRTAEAQLFSSAGSADETFVQRIFGFLPFLQKGFIFRLTDELTDDINKITEGVNLFYICEDGKKVRSFFLVFPLSFAHDHPSRIICGISLPKREGDRQKVSDVE